MRLRRCRRLSFYGNGRRSGGSKRGGTKRGGSKTRIHDRFGGEFQVARCFQPVRAGLRRAQSSRTPALSAQPKRAIASAKPTRMSFARAIVFRPSVEACEYARHGQGCPCYRYRPKVSGTPKNGRK
jgi:hypothetical protein